MTAHRTDGELLPCDDLVDALGRIPAANIGDAQDRLGVVTGLHAAWPGAQLAGRARTVWTRSGDNLYVHRMLDQAQPGDIIVINGQGDLTRALIGDLIGLRARTLGIGGFVIDGAVRDAEALGELGMPVFASGVTPAGPYKHGPGRLDVPVAIGGVVVQPGDIVIGDSDGVVVVAAAEAEAVLERARLVVQREADKRTELDALVAVAM